MKAIDIVNGPVWQSIRKLIPGATKVQIPGLDGVWFNTPGNLISAVVTEIVETGEWLVKSSISNVNVQNQVIVVSDPTDIPEAIAKVLSEYAGIEREGRTVGRAEELEQKLGTLTGVNLKELTVDDVPAANDFTDAISEIPREMSLI